MDVSHLQIQIIEKVSWKIESQESIKNSLISHWFQDQEENLNRKGKNKDHASTVHPSIKVLSTNLLHMWGSTPLQVKCIQITMDMC